MSRIKTSKRDIRCMSFLGEKIHGKMEKFYFFRRFERGSILEQRFSRTRKKVLSCFESRVRKKLCFFIKILLVWNEFEGSSTSKTESRVRKKLFLLKFYSFGINSKEALLLKMNQEFERNSVSLLKFYSFGIRKKKNSKKALLLKMNQEFERNFFY